MKRVHYVEERKSEAPNKGGGAGRTKPLVYVKPEGETVRTLNGVELRRRVKEEEDNNARLE